MSFSNAGAGLPAAADRADLLDRAGLPEPLSEPRAILDGHVGGKYPGRGDPIGRGYAARAANLLLYPKLRRTGFPAELADVEDILSPW